MQKFLLNEKVITELHMQSVNLKERSKYAKKYDLPQKCLPIVQQSKQIQLLLEQQRKILTEPKIDEMPPNQQKSPKTKHLLSTLRFQNMSQSQIQSTTRNVIKQNYFTARGIKKQPKIQKQVKKTIPRTCSLVTVMKPNQNYVAPYDVNPDLRFKRNRQCFISPYGVKDSYNKNDQKKVKFITQTEGDEKQNMNHTTNKRLLKKKHQSKKNLTIKEMVDREMQELVKKRKANCRTAPQKHISKRNQQNQGDYYLFDSSLFEEDIVKMQAKLYNQMRENREKFKRRNRDMKGINIDKNKPFGESEINKSTAKILKKYNCDGMAYFQKFIPQQ